jgi:hypothetical protein
VAGWVVADEDFEVVDTVVGATVADVVDEA